jgi:hypothetical protein
MSTVRQVYADEATVLVWENAATLEVATGQGRPGHAAVMVRTDSLPPVVQQGQRDVNRRRDAIAHKRDELDQMTENFNEKMKELGGLLKKKELAQGTAAQRQKARDKEMYDLVVATLGVEEGPKMQARMGPGKDFYYDVVSGLYGNSSAFALEIFKIYVKYKDIDGLAYDRDLRAALEAQIAQMRADAALLKRAQDALAQEIAGLRELCEHPAALQWSYLDETYEGKYCYISWWPTHATSGLKSSGNHRSAFARQEGQAADEFWDDMTDEISSRAARGLAEGRLEPRPGQVETPSGEWGYEPETVVNIPALGPANRYWGLSAYHMWQWYEDFRDNGPKEYKMVSPTQSCAGVAVRALVAGGARGFAPAPTTLFYMLPNDVKNWALQLQAEILRLNKNSLILEFDLLPKYRSDLPGSMRGPGPDAEQELWSPDAWKAHTYLKFGVRTGALEDIDHLLPRYHRCDFAGNSLQKYTLLTSIMRKCFQFIQEKGARTRAWGAVILASQCLNVVRSPAVRSLAS